MPWDLLLRVGQQNFLWQRLIISISDEGDTMGCLPGKECCKLRAPVGKSCNTGSREHSYRHTLTQMVHTHSPVSDERGEWGRGRPEDWPLPIRLFLLLVLQLQQQGNCLTQVFSLKCKISTLKANYKTCLTFFFLIVALHSWDQGTVKN